MPVVLCVKAEEVDTVAKRGKYTVSVVGCGQRGVLYAVAFAGAGYKVVCADADQSLVRRLARGKTPFSDRDAEAKVKGFVRTGQLCTTSEVKSGVSQGDIVVIAVAVEVDVKGNPDYGELESVCKQVGATLRQGSLVVYGGVAGFGLIEGLVRETLENTSGLKAGVGFGLAYSPLQVSDGFFVEVGGEELMVAANDKASLDAASVVFGSVAKKGVKQFLGVRMVELASLFAVAKRDVDVALANELAVLCERTGVDFFDVCKLLGSGVDRVFAPSIAAEEGRDEAYLLLEGAEALDVKLRLSALARQVNEDMVKHVVGLVQDTLRGCEKTLRRARVAVLGSVGQRSMAWLLVKLLETKGAKVSVFDPLFGGSEVGEAGRVFKRSLSEAVESTDCVVVLGGSEFGRLGLRNLRAVMRMPAVVVDLSGRVDAQKVEKEGFVYRGLGRGVEKR